MQRFFLRSMAYLDDVISLIEGKMNDVIGIAEALRVDNKLLKQRIDELLEQLSEKDEEVKVLESKYQSLKLTNTLKSSSGDVKNVKQQMDRMVREIDRCIALLNK